MNVYAELPVYQVCCVKGNLQVFSTLYFITTTVKVPTEKKTFYVCGYFELDANSMFQKCQQKENKNVEKLCNTRGQVLKLN